ncbi:MAG: PEP-CTERM sorting domain-containing protein [Nitrospirota bacterium]|nr:PEP-CTERM sorting domain-containing protein [Nitrospirota bacterium]
MDWAGALDVNLGGTHFTDWRLPTTVDGEYVWGYNGTTTAGYNITSSEMGHLFYTELLNKGYYTPTGACLYDDLFKNVGLKNTGDFQNLQNVAYWSSTTYLGSTNAAWKFSNYDGGQYDNDQIEGLYAIAVRPGDVAVAVAPEPISMVLFGTGGIFMAACRKLRKAAA